MPTIPSALIESVKHLTDARQATTNDALRVLVDEARDACTSAHTIHIQGNDAGHPGVSRIDCAHVQSGCAPLVAVADDANANYMHLVDLDPDVPGIREGEADAWTLDIPAHLVARHWPLMPEDAHESLPAECPPTDAHECGVKITDAFTLPIITDPHGHFILAHDVAAVLAYAGQLGYEQAWVNESVVVLHHVDTCEVHVWQTNAEDMWPAYDLFAILRLPIATNN